MCIPTPNNWTEFDRLDAIHQAACRVVKEAEFRFNRSRTTKNRAACAEAYRITEQTAAAARAAFEAAERAERARQGVLFA